MSIKNLKVLINEYLKFGAGGTYNATNPTGTISNEKIVANYVTVDDYLDTTSGKVVLSIKIKNDISNEEKINLANILNVNLSPHSYNKEYTKYFNSSHEATQYKNNILQRVNQAINKTKWWKRILIFFQIKILKKKLTFTTL